MTWSGTHSRLVVSGGLSLSISSFFNLESKFYSPPNPDSSNPNPFHTPHSIFRSSIYSCTITSSIHDVNVTCHPIYHHIIIHHYFNLKFYLIFIPNINMNKTFHIRMLELTIIIIKFSK